MLPVTFVATEPQFVEHVAPIWQALPEEYRGRLYVGHKPGRSERALLVARRLYGIAASENGYPPGEQLGICMTVAVGDLSVTRAGSTRLRFVFGEHGCGLTYQGASTSYIGSSARAKCDAILVPSERCVELQTEATPLIDVVNIGSSPKLDEWAPGGPGRARFQQNRGNSRPVVAISFHYDYKGVPECRSALSFYRPYLAALRAYGFDLIGHGHPKHWPVCRAMWEALGVEAVQRFDQVLERADLYAVDNSSTLYEFAAAGRPVVALNCPYYRKTVEHGLRFWQDIPGLQCDDPEQLGTIIERALADPPKVKAMREAAIANVYSQHDGRSAERAAAILVDLADQYEPPAIETIDYRPFKVYGPDSDEPVAEYAVRYEAETHADKFPGYRWALAPVLAESSRLD
jgi:hypothetical protein